MCSRRQKGLLQTVFCLVAVVCLGSGIFLYNHLQEKVKASEALALKNKQQQEALSAQLQGERVCVSALVAVSTWAAKPGIPFPTFVDGTRRPVSNMGRPAVSGGLGWGADEARPELSLAPGSA